jgi:hypothetical protein
MTESLCEFGYTEREAAFLAISSLQSGYFSRAQFNSFIGRECGALAQRFIDRGVQLGHFTPTQWFGNKLIYHVTARALYSQLGEAENRNRREHRPDTIRHRLLILDFLITRSSETWLLTERDRRTALFRIIVANSIANSRPVILGVLPSACRQPLALNGRGIPQFGFVDQSFGSFSEWETFLRSRRTLLNQIGDAEIVYASCDGGRFRLAQRMFRKIVAGEDATGELDRDRLQEFFRSRQLFDEKRYEHFDQARLDRLREDQRVYAGDTIDHLYKRWLQAGDKALGEIRSSRLLLSSQVLPESYKWLAPIKFRERKKRHGTNPRPTQES